MALDGITVSGIVTELRQTLLGGRIDKIYQPLGDEIIVTVRSLGKTHKVLVSANSSHPRIHLTELQKENPMAPPMFCMVLRKYIAGSKITNIYQPNFERILVIELESMNELGDIAPKRLLLEIMGKHSNIILVDESNRILDAIKRVSHEKSSVREVLPGKDYVFPPSQDKKNPLTMTKEQLFALLSKQDGARVQEVLYQGYTGISPIQATSLCLEADLEPSTYCGQLTTQQKESIYTTFSALLDTVKRESFSPVIYYDQQKILEFSIIPLLQFSHCQQKPFTSISTLLEQFYTEKDTLYHVRQKAHDMRRLLLSNIERCVKKQDIQKKTEKDVAGKDTWKIKGELLTANIHAIPKGVTTFRTVNFYDADMREMDIALDPTKTAAENAQHYFRKYNKAKRTLSALEIQKKQTTEELAYLESVLNSLESAKEEADLEEIRSELAEQGYMKRKTGKKKNGRPQKAAKPLHYISSDGYDIYVGKSNLQNDTLTLRFADSNDIWLHTKDIPGSHVIIQTKGSGTVPEQTLFEAANMAAFYSKGRASSQVPVDYTLRKYVKKPNGAKPGMVIYEKNKTLYMTPEETSIKPLEA